MHRKNLTIFNAALLVGFLGVITPISSAASEPAKRLRSEIEDGQTFALKGHVHPSIAHGVAQDRGEVASSKVMPKMTLHFALTAAQQSDLNQLLEGLQNRRSPQYHKFLTPEQYGERFGLNSADVAKMTAWLQGQGFTNVQVARSRMWINFKGNAGQVQEAFHTSIHNYMVNGEAHFANATEPELPKALNGVVDAIAGLHNFLPKARIRPRPRYTSSLTQSTFIAPDDWATIYDVKPLYSQGLDGSPIPNSAANYCGGSACSIVVVGQSDVSASDLANFRAAAGLPAKTITTVIPTGDSDPGFQSSNGDEGESDLDLEWSNAIAKNGNILFVTADQKPDNGVEDSIAWAIDNNMAPILSTSYGACETLEETPADIAYQNGLFAQANVAGMTIVGPAGDAGAADCDTGYPAQDGLAVDFPASSAYVTGVGGTQVEYFFNYLFGATVGTGTPGSYWSSSNNANGGSASGYIPEQVWNDSVGAGALQSGGGGVSIYTAKPSWQTGNGVPGGAYRTVPDIALLASPNEAGLLYCTDPTDAGTAAGVTICSNGFRNSDTTLNITGGTSAGPPSFSGVLAMLVQETGARLGNINPNIYSLADISNTAFHDITTGSNIVPCTIGSPNCTTGTMGYSAAAGYDEASGWGSIDALNLFEQWSEDIEISASPSALTVSAGASGTTNITISPYKNFTGSVALSCTVASALANVTCSVSPATLTTSGTATLTVNAASSAAAPWWRRFHSAPPAGIGLLALGFMMLAAVFVLRKQRFVYAWGAAALLVCLLGAVSCGGGGSSSSGGSGGSSTGPASESGNVTVTATSGQITNNTTVAVSIP